MHLTSPTYSTIKLDKMTCDIRLSIIINVQNVACLLSIWDIEFPGLFAKPRNRRYKP